MAFKELKYKEEYAEQLPDMFSKGENVAEICAELGIARSTFYKWLTDHEEFGEAYKVAQIRSEAWWAKLGREGASGKTPINPAVWIFNMKAKFNYSDATDVNLSLKGNMDIKLDAAEEMRKRGIPIPDIGMEDIVD